LIKQLIWYNNLKHKRILFTEESTMAKILLVEDDNNLREIYEARLLAEGYEIVSAEDGEQALAMAVKEKPDLIISDIMMPKISGFDMLDILRSTPETKHVKVIMMTALSQAEDKARADKLGADKYLVKSQVTLEDVAKVTKEMLQDDDTLPASIKPSVDQATVSATTPGEPQANLNTVTQPTPQAQPPIATGNSSTVQQVATPNTSQTAPPAQATTTDNNSLTDTTNTAANTAANMATTVNNLLQNDAPASSSASNQSDQPVHTLASNQIAGKKVINPINDLSSSSGPDLNALLAKEEMASNTQPAKPAEAPVEATPQKQQSATPTTETANSPTNEAPVEVPLPGNVQAPLEPSDPDSIAL